MSTSSIDQKQFQQSGTALVVHIEPPRKVKKGHKMRTFVVSVESPVTQVIFTVYLVNSTDDPTTNYANPYDTSVSYTSGSMAFNGRQMPNTNHHFAVFENFIPNVGGEYRIWINVMGLYDDVYHTISMRHVHDSCMGTRFLGGILQWKDMHPVKVKVHGKVASVPLSPEEEGLIARIRSH
ncbi:hypothetical protein BKA67DRAFT_661114 [Truncatella angustata]|uniref:Uncharacterized protein n=1 Tax=Truncatella angustata TaxID=152316 RepID=A0A9P8UHB7_9PEZI|nr:uncharacterized protein BKA67DRAFT_661114 [Truncatella angustata]KAH6652372.1 hypothetical protein BKA67DRAFT_661114 [Truncatella angustata]